jgi:hypothetical protein
MTKQEVYWTLNPDTGDALYRALDELDKDGVLYFIVEGGRTLLTHCLYALQGRLGEIPQSDLEWACKEAGIRPPGKQVITWTLRSSHLSGDAVDIVPLKGGKPDWDSQDERIVLAMKKQGFVWGGDWKPPDLPHFERRR